MPIENVILTTDNCRYCLMCRHVASIEHVTHRETLSPHGISRALCVFDQPLPEAIAAVRAEIVAQKLAPAVVYDLDARFNEWSTPFKQQKPQPVAGRGGVALFGGDAAQYLWPATVTAAP